MRDVQVSQCVSAEIDHDFMVIDDDVNGKVSLTGDEIVSLFSAWVQEGGLQDEAAVSEDLELNNSFKLGEQIR